MRRGDGSCVADGLGGVFVCVRRGGAVVCSVNLLLLSVSLYPISNHKAKTQEKGCTTFIIASLILALVINPFLNKLSINSTFVFPEQRQAIVLAPRKRKRGVRNGSLSFVLVELGNYGLR